MKRKEEKLTGEKESEKDYGWKRRKRNILQVKKKYLNIPDEKREETITGEKEIPKYSGCKRSK